MRCTAKPSSDSRSCAIRNGESSSVSATRVTSLCARTPYSTHQRPRGSVKRALAITFDGVMLSAGVPSSDAPSSGFDALGDRAAREARRRRQRQHAAAASAIGASRRQLDAGDRGRRA